MTAAEPSSLSTVVEVLLTARRELPSASEKTVLPPVTTVTRVLAEPSFTDVRVTAPEAASVVKELEPVTARPPVRVELPVTASPPFEDRRPDDVSEPAVVTALAPGDAPNVTVAAFPVLVSA